MHTSKVLIITYYWPPAGGPGVQRWLKFVKYLPKYSIKPIVFVPEKASYAIVDESLKKDVNNELVILKYPIKEPYSLANLFSKRAKIMSKGIFREPKKQSLIERILLYIRGNYFIPDARVGWVKPSISYLQDYIKTHDIKTVITTGPPHSMHLIGEGLKNILPITWIADFRDPWTTIGYHKQLKLTKASQAKHKALEQRVLNQADSVIVTSKVTQQEFQNITSTPITVITNGYDLEQVDKVALDAKFTLSHIGSLLSKRNPEVLWRVLQDLKMEHFDFASDFSLQLIGSVSETVLQTITKYGLQDNVVHTAYVPHKDAVTFQRKSQILLQIEIDSKDTQCIIPGKLFEYMVSGRPIIALGPEGSDVETILKETNTGDYFLYSDYDALKAKLLTHYKAFKNGNLITEPKGIERYSRKALTNTLATLIKTL